MGEGNGGGQDRVDISSLDPAMRYELHRRLTKAGVPFTQVRHELMVPARRGPWVVALMADVAEDAVGDAAASEAPTPPAPDPLARSAVPGVGEPAARWQRLAGYVIDTSIFLLPARAASRAGAPTWVPFAALAVQAVVVVAMVAVVGASPGKLAVGARVVEHQSGGGVSWGRSAIRWLVPYAAVPLAFVDPWFAWVGVVVWCGNIGLVLVHPEGRALHDLAVGTIVVRTEGIEPGRR